ncbi:unnamed protein product [Oppiella nova]|uniref:Uncharacterized protein n=1 Tax=Oppiella nova TaxID=334625 RepID=A0A7R9R1K6_9ACAR|nr:unnamed protein product [Oppiella nova]CAG2183674.1 unnamed protein product [Oppiella nova]
MYCRQSSDERRLAFAATAGTVAQISARRPLGLRAAAGRRLLLPTRGLRHRLLPAHVSARHQFLRLRAHREGYVESQIWHLRQLLPRDRTADDRK